ncbi:hypothetical protein PoB_006390900 [Plakobranchus ocellatus]|uniref:Uncharacterized protein n=1 Tax=Plakobranchus ocellatus TaxID=259542 RepID=A0AAV4CZP1_9GAST|nr:hypothetical protein PoB_006390900 [Plakobranchus ocellatus]
MEFCIEGGREKKTGYEFLYIASPQRGDLRLSGPPSGQGAGSGAVAGLEPATEGSLQISGRTRKPLCYRRPIS